jgi:hypothetical protein
MDVDRQRRDRRVVVALTLCAHTRMSVNRCQRSNLCDPDNCPQAPRNAPKNGQNPSLSGSDSIGASDHTQPPPNARQIAVPEDDCTYVVCSTCNDYIDRRLMVLVPHVTAEAARQGIDPSLLMHRFRQRVHARHIEGLPLS